MARIRGVNSNANISNESFVVSTETIPQQTAFFFGKDKSFSMLKVIPNTRAVLLSNEVYTRWMSLEKSLDVDSTALALLLLNLHKTNTDNNNNEDKLQVFETETPSEESIYDFNRCGMEDEDCPSISETSFPDRQSKSACCSTESTEMSSEESIYDLDCCESILLSEDEDCHLISELSFSYCRSKSICYSTELRDLSLTDMALLSLPDVLETSPSLVRKGRHGVWSKYLLKKGTIFGPYIGFFSGTCVAQHQDMLCLLSKHPRPLEYYQNLIVTVDEEVEEEPECEAEFRRKKVGFNWMVLVACGKSQAEKNVDIISHKNSVYYYVTKDVEMGREIVLYVDFEQLPQVELTLLDSTAVQG